MAEIINFAKAKKNFDKKVKLIFERDVDDKKLIQKCCKENKIKEDSSKFSTVYQVDEHIKVEIINGTDSYIITRSYPIGE